MVNDIYPMLTQIDDLLTSINVVLPVVPGNTARYSSV